MIDLPSTQWMQNYLAVLSKLKALSGADRIEAVLALAAIIECDNLYAMDCDTCPLTTQCPRRQPRPAHSTRRWRTIIRIIQ